MRYKCSEGRCFNIKYRPKIEVFHVCFPGKINFGDVDAEVEVNSYFCQLEWKGVGGNVKTGQRIKFERYTTMKYGNVVFVAEGNAETMDVVRYCMFWDGVQRPWKEATLEELQGAIERWAKRAWAGNFSRD